MPNAPTSQAPHPTVCALCASAGGLPALMDFFQRAPADLGLAYVVVVHLAPDQPSALAEILSRATPMKVLTVTGRVALKADQVHVAPPDQALVIEGETVRTEPFAAPRGRRRPIDKFLDSLAGQRGGGIAVILSGEGSDGAAGALAVKEAGGLVLAQDPGEAEHPAMPLAAIATGAVDVTAPVAALALRVADLAQNAGATEGLSSQGDDALGDILAALRAGVGHDFSDYKPATLLRRIGRRMRITRSATMADYAALLRTSEDETRALFSDLLISVTSFFRDPTHFDALRRDAIAPIFDRLDAQAHPSIRAWSVGCASGEEAYSLAMLLTEEAETRRRAVSIQVFATDIDEAALARGRAGLYGPGSALEIPEKRLGRFFRREGDGWRVRQDLRDMVVFASHSVLKDPPFMHLDLVLCRNLLIYTRRDLQRRILGILRYSLDPGGVLMLGASETVEPAAALFSPLDPDARLFRAEALPDHALIMPRGAVGAAVPVTPLAKRADAPVGPATGAAHLAALEAIAPPTALVGADMRLLHLSPTAGRFLAPSGGPLAQDLPSLARPELRLDLKVGLTRALEAKEPTLTLPIRTGFDGTYRRVLLHILPDPSAAPPAPRALVLFLDAGPVDAEDEDTADAPPDEARRLRRELRAAQERLAASRGEHEAAIEDLRAANEELQSVNEEYRSTAEELETSKEELQSVNEELQTLNAELKEKFEAISSAHGDLRNLVAATDFGTLFLDPDLCVRMFTPRVTEVVALEPGDVGRRISDFAHVFEHGDAIVADARRVLADLAPVERHARTGDGRWYTIRFRPYRTMEGRAEGVVVTFLDVTGARETTERLRTSEERFQSLLRATDDAVFLMGPDWGQMRMLDGGTFLAPSPEPVTDWLSRYVPEDARAGLLQAVHAALSGKRLLDLEHRVTVGDGSTAWAHTRAAPILAPDGAIREWFGVSSNVTERRRAEDRLREAQELLGLATDASRLGWITWDADSGLGRGDARACEVLGLDPAKGQPSDWLAHLHPEDRARVEAELARQGGPTQSFETVFRVLRGDGTIHHVQASGTIAAGAGGAAAQGSALVKDVTESWRAEETRRLLLEELNHRVKNMLTVILSIAARTRGEVETLDTFTRTFEERLLALGMAHDALTDTGWKSAGLGGLVESAVSLFLSAKEARVSILGPEVGLGPSAATTFSLALHELCTNALKHGALSKANGRVDISWSIEESAPRRLVFVWAERDGPAVAPPGQRGAGFRLLDRDLPAEVDGTADLTFAPTGLVYRLEAPLSEQIHDG